MATLEVTTKIGCSIFCTYCPQEKIIRAYSERSKNIQMSFENFKDYLKRIAKDVKIHFTGMSEPFLNPEAVKMILYAYREGYKIAVGTTLVGLSLADIELLEKIPFDFFVVHLPGEEAAEKIEVDEQYLNLLARLVKAKIKLSYHFHGELLHPKIKVLLKDYYVEKAGLNSRAANVTINNMAVRRHRGPIGCLRNMAQNVLLPNGDVVLCCMDYGLKHVLGNLLHDDYASLSGKEEFLKVKKGLSDDSLDILCRYCKKYAYSFNLLIRAFKPLIYLPGFANKVVSKFKKEVYRLAKK